MNPRRRGELRYSQRGMSMRHSILRGGYMSYIRAEEVLPKELIEAIQQYISGENIYIPCVPDNISSDNSTNFTLFFELYF